MEQVNRAFRLRSWLYFIIGLWVVIIISYAHFSSEQTRTVQGQGAGFDESAGLIKRASSAVAVTSDGQLLLAVNPDSNTVSIVELNGPFSVTELTVGADPRTVTVNDAGTRAYTANRGGNNISVIDLGTRQLLANIPVGARPYGILVSPDGRSLYVAEQGQDRLTVIDTITLTINRTIPVPDRPSGLALTDDGRFLFITHLLSKVITVLAVDPYASYLPEIRLSDDGTSPASGQLPDPLQAITSTIPLWPDSNLVQSIVIAPDGRQAFVPHTRSNSSNPALTLDTTVFPLVSLIDIPTRQHLAGQQLNLDILDPPAVGLPFDAAFTPDGGELWVLNAASNDITVIDVSNRNRLAHIEVGHNPRGIVLSPDGTAAYVNNTLEGTVAVVDTTAYTVTQIITLTDILLDPVLLTGKRLFNSSNDLRMGQDQWMSCNSCHFDGESDGRTWLLGFAGPRNTTSLGGMNNTLPLRWSAEWDEAADSEFAIRMDSFGTGLVPGPMNCSLNPPDCVNHPPHAGLSTDLDALAAYINSLTVPLSPGHLDGQPLSLSERQGQIYFNDPAVGCASCHPGPLYTDNLVYDVGTVTNDEQIGPYFNTPSLLGIYDTAPYFHDGSARTLYQAITRPSDGNEHNVTGRLTEKEIQDLITFLLALPYENS